MLSSSVFSRRIKGRPSSANTRVPTMPRAFIVSFRSMLLSLLKPSLMPTPSTEQFVLHWLEQVRLYEELVDASAALSDSVKFVN